MENKEIDEKPKEARLVCSVRFTIAILGFLGFMCMNAQRTAISVAIVCMVNHTGVQLLNEDSSAVNTYINNSYLNASSSNNSSVLYDNLGVKAKEEDQCQRESGNDTEKTTQDGEFIWTKPQQGIVLSSFFYGYMISQIPGGWLAGRIGGRKVFGVFMLVVAAASLLTPMAARIDFKFLVVLRILAGFGSGVTYPAMHALWGQWAPPLERSRLAGISYAGSQVGNVIALPLSGFLCAYGFDGGWPSIFYILGTAGGLWSIAWLIIVGDSPEEARRISDKEREYIVGSLRGQKADHAKHKPSCCEIPWLSFITSLPVWAIVVGNTCGDYGLYTFETCLPTYLKEVLKFDIKNNGVFSALPFVAFWASITAAGLIADKLRTSGLLSTANTRKVMEGVGMMIPATLLIGVGFLDCTQWKVAISMLIIGVGMSGFQWSGYLVNHVDIAPEYAGLLMGMSNCVACLSGIAAPSMVGALTQDQTREQWQIVFFIIAGVLIFGAIFFGIFAKGELQPWAYQKTDLDISQKEEGENMLQNSVSNGGVTSPQEKGNSTNVV